MKPLAVEIHPEAVLEAQAAREWYESKSPEAAAAFMAELDIGIDSIRAHQNSIRPIYMEHAVI